MAGTSPDMSICALGAAPDTGNLGVSALSESIVTGVARERRSADLTVFDGGRGLRRASRVIDGAVFAYSLCGLRRSRRYYRPESMLNVRLSARLGGLRNPAAQTIRQANLVLDISGGDSFSDIYGIARFKTMAQAKEIVLEQKRSLVFLPQTYGPFASEGSRREASKILRAASAAWARDPDSYEAMCDLLGDEVDLGRHRLGVDVAFALEAAPVPGLNVAEQFDFDGPLVGVNISGLLFNQATAGTRFGFSLDYEATALDLVKRLVDDGARVLLVPHVHSAGDPDHSDRRASSSVLAQLDPAQRERVVLLRENLTAGETKWVIGHCDWFCGARMHSTIAALSSSVPATAIAYSSKMAGVFAECGQREHVLDARELSTGEAGEALWQLWSQRGETRERLRRQAPKTVQRARAQWNEILDGAVAPS